MLFIANNWWGSLPPALDLCIVAVGYHGELPKPFVSWNENHKFLVLVAH